jgi:exonuclease III
MDSIINFFSLNVGMSNTLAGLSAIIKAENLDIIFLQEVRLTSEQLEHLLRGFKAAVNVDPSQPSKPGTAIVWRETLPVIDVCPLVLCRAQMATLGPYRLVNVYAPSGSDKKHERNVFFGQEIFTSLQLDLHGNWILGGDYNSVLKAIDIEGGVGFNQKKCPALEDLVQVAGLADFFRAHFPRKQEYTFFKIGQILWIS